MIDVVSVEDHELTRAGLRTAVDAEPDMQVTGEAGDGRSGLGEVERLHPKVAVVDIGLPAMDGIELTRHIRDRSPQTRVVILTMHDLETEVLAALSAGADAYCLKTSSSNALISRDSDRRRWRRLLRREHRRRGAAPSRESARSARRLPAHRA